MEDIPEPLIWSDPFAETVPQPAVSQDDDPFAAVEPFPAPRIRLSDDDPFAWPAT